MVAALNGEVVDSGLDALVDAIDGLLDEAFGAFFTVASLGGGVVQVAAVADGAAELAG